jgi:multicomponent Na+:H+ antiporter subunit G
VVTLANIATLAFLSAGIVFFLAGTTGLLRFPDVHTRLHALTKADNLGLGLIVIGLLPQLDTVWLALKVIVVWLLAILAAATMAQLVARAALSGTQQPPARHVP